MLSDSEHPTPQAKVAHFMATVDDYEEMSDMFPLPDTINIMAGYRDDLTSRWRTVFHAALLRKYFQPGDKLLLSKVVEALSKCVTDAAEDAQGWAETVDKWAQEVPSVTVYGLGPNNEQVTDTELLEHLLYGRFLHGDYTRWMTTDAAPSQATDRALWGAVNERSRRVRQLAAWIREEVADGTLVY